jgi:hypothetical protein
MSRQPIDNRDLRIFDLNINESLLAVAETIVECNKVTDPILEEINRTLGDIAAALHTLIRLYQHR